MGDKIKLYAAAGVVVLALVGFYYFEDQSTVVRVAGLLALLGVSLAIALQAEQGRLAWGFVKESRSELRKVVWPNRKETTQATAMVLVMVVLIGLFLWMLDMFLGWAVKALTGQGG